MEDENMGRYMIKRIFFLLMCCFVMANVSTAKNLKKRDKYLKASVGIPAYSHVELHHTEHHVFKKIKFVPNGSIALGKKLGNSNIIIEIEGAYHYIAGKSDSVKADVAVMNGFINAVWLKNLKHSKMSPYVGLGVGVAHTRAKNMSISGLTALRGRNLTNAIGQGFIGAEYNYTNKIFFIGDLRYAYLGKMGHESPIPTPAKVSPTIITSNIHDISVNFGLKYKF